tara:strand:- start:188 stop:460 length:273 start_codon:yes stop_codon:yes gene_type:complete
MGNVYLEKLLTWQGICLIIAFIILNSSNTYLKSVIMEYFLFDELLDMLKIGPFAFQYAWLISIGITILGVGIHKIIFFDKVMDSLFRTNI